MRDKTRNSSFSCLWSFSWTIAQSFGVLGRFTTTLRTNTCLRVYDQNLIVFVFYGRFISYCPLFRGLRAIYNDIKTWYMLERYDPKLVVFRVLWLFSWAIAHSFGVPGRFTATLRPDTCLRVMTKKSSFSCFMVVFMGYCPQFLGSRWICMPRKNPYMIERYDQKLVVFAFYGRFHELLPTILGL
jgi:hypothetical protein